MLAEEVTRPCACDLDLASVPDVDDLHAAGENDEQRLGIRPRLEDDTAGVPAEIACSADKLE